jgi:hypothetical protein
MAMDLREAMSQIAEIRQQMARTELFRGYRSVPVAFSGLLAWGAAIAQSVWIPDPMREISSYLVLWLSAAAIGIFAAAAEMALRARHDPRWAREHTWVAVEQFLPCLLAGGLATLVIARSPEPVAWLLPGLWSIFFSLGVFASRRLLPRATIGVAFYYLLAGLASLSLARGEAALSPWAMGLPFGGGQLLAAFVLYRTLERDHGIE